MPDYINIGKAKEFAAGEVRCFAAHGETIAVVHSDGRLYAFSNRCTHRSVKLSEGFVSGNRVFCPLHDSEFNLETGQPLAGPAALDLPIFDVKLEGEDVLVDVAPVLAEGYVKGPAFSASEVEDDDDEYA